MDTLQVSIMGPGKVRELYKPAMVLAADERPPFE